MTTLTPGEDRLLEVWLRFAALSPEQLRQFAELVGSDLGP